LAHPSEAYVSYRRKLGAGLAEHGRSVVTNEKRGLQPGSVDSSNKLYVVRLPAPRERPSVICHIRYLAPGPRIIHRLPACLFACFRERRSIICPFQSLHRPFSRSIRPVQPAGRPASEVLVEPLNHRSLSDPASSILHRSAVSPRCSPRPHPSSPAPSLPE